MQNNYTRCIVVQTITQSMGSRRHGHQGSLVPSGNVVTRFCALLVTGKRVVNELFMHYFHNLSSASGALPPRPPLGSIPGPAGDFHPQTRNLPTHGKNPTGAHGAVSKK